MYLSILASLICLPQVIFNTLQKLSTLDISVTKQLVLAYPGCPGKEAVKGVSICLTD